MSVSWLEEKTFGRRDCFSCDETMTFMESSTFQTIVDGLHVFPHPQKLRPIPISTTPGVPPIKIRSKIFTCVVPVALTLSDRCTSTITFNDEKEVTDIFYNLHIWEQDNRPESQGITPAPKTR